jgi:hypothetical protein
MVFEIAIVNAIFKNNKRGIKKTDKFSNDNSDVSKNNNTQFLIYLIQLCIFIYALVLFFKCKKFKDRFDFLEFLGAFCYPLFYVIYRLIVPVNEENCKSNARKIAEELAKVKSF